MNNRNQRPEGFHGFYYTDATPPFCGSKAWVFRDELAHRNHATVSLMAYHPDSGNPPCAFEVWDGYVAYEIETVEGLFEYLAIKCAIDPVDVDRFISELEKTGQIAEALAFQKNGIN